MLAEPTANFVSGKLVTCYRGSCDIYNNGMWTELVKTRMSRIFHSSVQTEDQILLIGGGKNGVYTRSTEWIPLDGSPSQPGPFEIRHGGYHCTIQVSPDTIVVTGGDGTEYFVTEYQLTGDGAERELNGMVTKRWSHACSHYLDASGQQVRKWICIDSTLIIMILMI